MSGTIQGRVNRFWDSTTRVNTSPAAWFWEWLHFVNDHPGMTIVEAGTGTTSHGSAIPPAWLSWDRTTDPGALSPPLAGNSWVVFRAVNADPLLGGLGGMQWECKIQYTDGTAYVDPSGTDYGKNGGTHMVVLRAAPYGGWTGSPTWDFVAPAGEALPPDFRLYEGQDDDFYLDLVGDDDTIVWKGATCDVPTDDPRLYSRGGYLGMIVRRSPNIEYPFFVMAGPLTDENEYLGDRSINSRDTASSFFVWRYTAGSIDWPTFSIGADKTACTKHLMNFPSPTMAQIMAPNPWNGKRNFFGGILREKQAPNHWSVMGQLRFFWGTDYSYVTHTLVGDNDDLIQICEAATTHGGILMQWPAGVLPIW